MIVARNATIGERVRYYRTSKEMSMEKLGSMMTPPITAQQVAKYETASSRWPADTLCSVAQALRVDIRVLAGLDDKAPKSTEEWEAERYKAILLNLHVRARKVVYRIIDSVATLEIKE